MTDEAIRAIVKEEMHGFATELLQGIGQMFELQNTRMNTMFAEQDKRIDAKFAEQDKHIDAKFAEQDKRIDTKFAEQDKRIDAKFAATDLKIDIIANQTAGLTAAVTALTEDVTEIRQDLKVVKAAVAHHDDEINELKLAR